MTEDIYTQEERKQEERHRKLTILIFNEEAFKISMKENERLFKNMRRDHGRTQRERLKLQKEIERNRRKAKQIDYRIRKRTQGNFGKAYDSFINK